MEEIDDRGTRGFRAVEARYEGPEEIRIPMGRGEEMALGFTLNGQGWLHPRDKVEFRQETSLHWRFRRPADLPSIFARVRQVRDFLSLAVGRAVSITSVEGFRGGGDSGERKRRRPIKIYWGIPHNPVPPDSPMEPAEMLFTLDAIPNPSKVLKRWVARRDRLKPVFNLYFGVLYHPDLYLEVRFLSLAQALETYDIRRRRQRQEMPLAARTEGALMTLQLQVILELSFLRQLGFPCETIEGVLERARRFEQIDQFRPQLPA